MAKKGVNIDELLQFQSKIKDFEKNIDSFKEECCMEVTSRLLTMLIKDTPVGQYVYITKKGKRKKYKLGGTLRRGWTAQKDKLSVTKHGNIHKSELINDVEYSSYVEFGHRTRNLTGWVKGKYILTNAEKRIDEIAPKIVEKKIIQRFGDLSK